MRSILLAGVLAAAVVLPGVAVFEAAQAQGDPIAQRKEGLKRMGGQMEAIKAILDKGEPVAPVAARAQEMGMFFVGLPTLFPPGSDKGETRALPAVWSDRDGFDKAMATMVTALGKLRSAADAGDASATAAAFREAGGACGACHRAYRAR
ncbi:cytochrome c [Roseomonas sp. GC11]|uniref:c-type cytochrome n=1 Tax=Roseomonas sp. GC11 TaxID=2950546 RepID=UPI00210D4293|nr:cytochrome c [Roseomonas sp. GC11]MCQ4161050.1 cytochrome c [Roseomonas sp. GC11]